jgi:hypothetical protein
MQVMDSGDVHWPLLACGRRARPRGAMMRRMNTELAPGNRFSDLELPDHSGNQRRLSDLAGGDPLILNFYRGWW